MNWQISETVRQELLRLARGAIIRSFQPHLPSPKRLFDHPDLNRQCGVFITLTNQDRLRGCIGTFSSDRPLDETVMEYAVESLKDSRFQADPITLTEVPDLQISVSVLSPLTEVHSLEEIEIGRHGIRVGIGNRQGCYLPEVAEEQNWSSVQFVEHCLRHKAGLPPKSWQDPQAHLEIFSSIKFHD